MNYNNNYPCGTLIMAGLPGTHLDSETRDLILNHGVGNFIIFRRNAADGPEALLRLCEDLKETCRHAGLPPPVISVDQEGGTVQRLGPPFWERLPSAHDAGNAAHPLNAVNRLAEKTAEILEDCGINMNMAPVLDIAGPAAQGVLRGRCFGNRTADVSEAGRYYIKSLQKHSVAAVAKHFPGIGMVREDPHLKRPVVDTDYGTVMEHIQPFRHAVMSEVSAVMTSHVIFTAIDPELPASFSPAVADDLLRRDLGFQGVLVTDDLEMGGITEYDTVAEAALRAFIAGHDLLLVCHSPKRIRATVHEMQAACRDGRISTERLNTSLSRMEHLRNRFCM